MKCSICGRDVDKGFKLYQSIVCAVCKYRNVIFQTSPLHPRKKGGTNVNCDISNKHTNSA